MTTTGQIIRWSTAGAVVGVAAVAAVASYEHAYALVPAHGETGWIGRLVPLTVDGLIYASSMVMLDSARREVPVPALARWLLGNAGPGGQAGACPGYRRGHHANRTKLLTSPGRRMTGIALLPFRDLNPT